MAEILNNQSQTKIETFEEACQTLVPDNNKGSQIEPETNERPIQAVVDTKFNSCQTLTLEKFAKPEFSYKDPKILEHEDELVKPPIV